MIKEILIYFYLVRKKGEFVLDILRDGILFFNMLYKYYFVRVVNFRDF